MVLENRTKIQYTCNAIESSFFPPALVYRPVAGRKYQKVSARPDAGIRRVTVQAGCRYFCMSLKCKKIQVHFRRESVVLAGNYSTKKDKPALC